MGALYLGTDIQLLADRLAGGIGESLQADFFTPVTITVANRPLERWLRLRLARQLGVAINLRIDFLETLLWELLRELDGRAHELPLEPMREDTYRLMILSVLLDENDASPELAPLRDYLLGSGGGSRARACRAWQLAARLGDLIRDYEFHRREMILRWLADADGLQQATAEERRLERSQKALFRLITAEPAGLRARLSRASGKLRKTLPQYAGELLELPAQELRQPARRTVHVFGVTYLSAFHHRVLGWLGNHFDLRIYYVNPLVGRLPASAPSAALLRQLADRYRTARPAQRAAPAKGPADELLFAWGTAGVEGLGLLAGLLEDHPTFTAQLVRGDCGPSATSVLGALQCDLLGTPPANESAPESRPLTQDKSLEIVACPGIFREVETVYQSILHNLQTTRDLKQTDIAVVVTDLERYRPVFQAVFGRQPGLLTMNLSAAGGGGRSGFAQAVRGLLELALETFTRARVFAVLLNPCFLERLGVGPEQSLSWLDWVEALGVYNSWDANDKRERGYPESPLYSWQLGLRRLRLGRLMEGSGPVPGGRAPRYADVIPFADLTSGDRAQLDVFCRAVEGLLPRLLRLRRQALTGAAWADELRRLVADYLDVPAERPEDERLRGRLLAALDGLQTLDRLGVGGHAPALPLALVREFVHHQLDELAAPGGDASGVTIGRFTPLRTLPFRIIYIVGLEEGTFPGPNQLPSYDLRGKERCPGDVRPAEGNRFLFLDALLAAREKLYLLYTCRDLQKDRDLEPASPVNQLRRYVETHLLGGRTFQPVTMPLSGSDPAYLTSPAQPHTDVLVNYNEADRLLAIVGGQKSGELRLDGIRMQQLEELLAARSPNLELTPAAIGPPRRPPTVTLHELRRFLSCPAEAAVRRHLHLTDDDEFEPVDDEPFVTPTADELRMGSEFLNDFVAQSVANGVDSALGGWQQRFRALYHDWGLCGKTPEGAFGQADCERFQKMLGERLEGEQGLAAFLRQRPKSDFVGPVLIGESMVPVGPRVCFPAVKLSWPAELWTAHVPREARLCGTLPHVWRDSGGVDVLVQTWSRKVLADQLSGPLLEPALFYLALLAGTQRGPVGTSARWLNRREVRIHLAGPAKMITVIHAAGDIKPAEARDYLIELLRDFLDRASFDRLPFDLFYADKELRGAYLLDEADPRLADLQGDYRARIEEVYEEDQEGDHPCYRPMKLLEIAVVSIPAEAFDKVRRRFRLLDRALARLRAALEGNRRG